jgi:hypothetical protein
VLDLLLEDLLSDMSEELSNDDRDSNSSDKEPNTELIYKYTESLLKTQSESLNRLDTKLSAFLAFNRSQLPDRIPNIGSVDGSERKSILN